MKAMSELVVPRSMPTTGAAKGDLFQGSAMVRLRPSDIFAYFVDVQGVADVSASPE
jgi:hypothetical protein